MEKLIEKLWEGQILPMELLGKENDKLRKIEAILFDRIENLKDKIDDDEVESLQRLANDCLNESSKQAFIDGFSLGVGITTEAMQNTGNLTIK